MLFRMARGAKIGLNGPVPNRVKVLRYFLGLAIETNNFDFEVKVIVGLKNTHPDGWITKTGLNDPHDR